MKKRYNIFIIVGIVIAASAAYLGTKKENSFTTNESLKIDKIQTLKKIRLEEVKHQHFTMLKKGDAKRFIQHAFEQASINKTIVDREVIRAEGNKDPLLFTKEIKDFLHELPLEQVEKRKLAVSFLMDVLIDSQEKFQADEKYETAVYAEVYQISDELLAQQELLVIDMSHEDYALLSPLEKTQFNLVEKDGQIFKSTLSAKIMGVSLAKLDSDLDRSEQYLDKLSSKVKESEPQSYEVLASVRNMNFHQSSF